jgi:hypothetical protein
MHFDVANDRNGILRITPSAMHPSAEDPRLIEL